ERVQAGSDYRSQLSSLPSLHGSRPWTSTPPAHRILVYSLGIRQTAFTHFPITRIRKTTPERTPSPSMRTRVSGEPFPLATPFTSKALLYRQSGNNPVSGVCYWPFPIMLG